MSTSPGGYGGFFGRRPDKHPDVKLKALPVVEDPSKPAPPVLDRRFFVHRLREHFGTEPKALPVISESFAGYDHPNVHIALEEHLAGDGRSAEVLGVSCEYAISRIGLSDLVAPGNRHSEPVEGPVIYANVPLEGGRVLACIARGLYLVRDGGRPLAVFVTENGDILSPNRLSVEVMAAERTAAERFLRDLKEGMRARNVYRGHVLSLDFEDSRSLRVRFHRLPEVDREGVILPGDVLDRVERQTIGFGLRARRLLEAGRHLKRGLLLHGPPGTGKTLTAMYLAGAMRDRTVLLLTGRGLGLVGRTCAMARALQPSTVILEDVDLVAEERTKGGAGCATPLLFELLNEMDGLADDADILFLLTTNRPDLLEPALAARPGRVDQAIEIPLPDESCRRRLIELYGKGLTLRVADLPRLIARTEGASAAFLRELLRRAALYAVDDGPEIVVEDRHLDEALRELVVQGGDLTKSLLGFRPRIGFRRDDAS